MKRFPDWLRKERLSGSTLLTSRILEASKLHTVCESARCPNRQECYSRNTATFMILGDVCTRKCGFCAVETGKALLVDAHEPVRVAEAVRALGLSHAVVTSVARDDLKDGGAEHFYQTILAVRQLTPETTIEVLTPDFKCVFDSLNRVCEASPDILNHNLETVERLTPFVRSPNAGYRRSLQVLDYVKKTFPKILTKSGMMLGLGEAREEVIQALHDLREAGCDILTMGQYLQPAEEKLAVQEFLPPAVFEAYQELAFRMGFREAYCGPFVRSSYHAGELREKLMRKRKQNYVYA